MKRNLRKTSNVITLSSFWEEIGRPRKLSPAVEQHVRDLYHSGEYSQAALAREFGVRPNLISKIVYYTRKGS